jgi:hypothetical protein
MGTDALDAIARPAASGRGEEQEMTRYWAILATDHSGYAIDVYPSEEKRYRQILGREGAKIMGEYDSSSDAIERVRQCLTNRDREMAENALSAWGIWTGYPGSLRLRDAVASGIAAAREEGRREELDQCTAIAAERDVRHDGHYDQPLSAYDRGYAKACSELADAFRKRGLRLR